MHRRPTGLLVAGALAATLALAGLVCGCTAQATAAPWWSRFQRPGATQTRNFRGLPGSVAARCVEVGNHGNVRSGGFVAGNFRSDIETFASVVKQPKEVKIYWIPLHVGTMPALTVLEVHVGFPHTIRTTVWREVAANPGVVFYPSATPVPVPGTWRLTASAGPNRGCFVVTFPG